MQLHSAGGMTDSIVASIAFLVLAFTPQMLWGRIRALPEWMAFKPTIMIFGVALPTSYIALSLLSNSPIEGLVERILATAISLWLALLAAYVVRTYQQGQHSSRSAA